MNPLEQLHCLHPNFYTNWWKQQWNHVKLIINNSHTTYVKLQRRIKLQFLQLFYRFSKFLIRFISTAVCMLFILKFNIEGLFRGIIYKARTTKWALQNFNKCLAFFQYLFSEKIQGLSIHFGSFFLFITQEELTSWPPASFWNTG